MKGEGRGESCREDGSERGTEKWERVMANTKGNRGREMERKKENDTGE